MDLTHKHFSLLHNSGVDNFRLLDNNRPLSLGHLTDTSLHTSLSYENEDSVSVLLGVI